MKQISCKIKIFIFHKKKLNTTNKTNGVKQSIMQLLNFKTKKF